MTSNEYIMRPVDHITTDAIGSPGNRVFFIQAIKDKKTITLIVEKIQIQSLAIGVEQFLVELQKKFPNLLLEKPKHNPAKMQIHPPVDPLFRVGALRLDYDVPEDLVGLIATEALVEGENPDDLRVVRFWCTRNQIRAMCHWGIEVASQGRPLCPQCSQPMDPEGHFCPKKNGHKS